MNNGITTLYSLTGSATISGPNSGSGLKVDSGLGDAVGPGKTDQTSLSTVSDLLTQALSTSNPVSDVRFEKILPLQQAIANGTYNVSASDVAGKIVDSLLS